MYREETGKVLNYFTMEIKEPEIAKDFEDHQTQHLNNFFWISQVVAILNFLILCNSAFLQKFTDGTGDVIGGALCVVIVCFIWPFLYFRWKRLTKYLFVVWFALATAQHIAKQLTDKGSPWNVQGGIEHTWISLTIDYIIIMTSASYC